MIEKKKVYDFTTEICGGDVKGSYVVMYQYNKTEEEANKEIEKTIEKLGAKYYSTKKEDRGLYIVKIPPETTNPIKERNGVQK